MSVIIKHRRKKLSGFEVFNGTLFVLIGLIMLFPFWNIVVISLTDYRDYVNNPLMLIPKNLNFSAYNYIFSTDEIANSLWISVFTTVLGTLVSIVITTAAAYALSKKGLPGRNMIFSLILVTMFVNGGIIPMFLLMKNLSMYNTIWVLILPNAVNTFYLIIMKNYFNTIPEGLEEAAKIDGANDLRILIKIVLPISMPIIATMLLFYGVEKWNEWWNALLYIGDPKLYPLQMVLRNLIVKSDPSSAMATAYTQASSEYVAKESVKMATAVVAIVPVAIVYPFLAKYFTKGVMIGAIKS